jgi:hypothetical protein
MATHTEADLVESKERLMQVMTAAVGADKAEAIVNALDNYISTKIARDREEVYD